MLCERCKDATATEDSNICLECLNELKEEVGEWREVQANIVAYWECPYCGKNLKREGLTEFLWLDCVCEETGQNYEVNIQLFEKEEEN